MQALQTFCFKSALFYVFCIVWVLAISSDRAVGRTLQIGVLMASDVRQTTVDGLRKGCLSYSIEEGKHTYVYSIQNAEGDRKKLPAMAEKIIAEKPDVAIAAGGIEADALLVASAGTDIPVVFLSVSSSVERGIVASMVSSDNNFTGIDTNDTMLTAKRLWYIKKILPKSRRVFCFHVPSIVASVQSLEVARQSAEGLGLEIIVAEVESDEDIKRATDTLSRAAIDVILQLPVAPIDRALPTVIFPKAMEEKIPIFGYGENSIKNGAFASYAGSRYANGEQAVRLIHKIVNGIKPKDIPIETPEKLEFVINKQMVEKLGLKLPGRVWRMANQVVDLQI